MQTIAALLTIEGVQEEEVRLVSEGILVCQGENLRLYAVVESGLGPLCIFASSDASREAVECSFAARELLLLPPVVPLRKTERGLQTLRREELTKATREIKPKPRVVAPEPTVSALDEIEEPAECEELSDEDLSCDEIESCSSSDE